MLSFINKMSAKNSKELYPINLKCEYQTSPNAINELYPRLSWVNKYKQGCRGKEQTAWQIQVSSTMENLLQNKADLWDSQKVLENNSNSIRYNGEMLHSAQSCWWRVRVWDENDNVSDWSNISYWSMGILKDSDWYAKWIGAPWQGEAPLDCLNNQTPPPAPLFRKKFNLNKHIKEAKAFVSGLGYFEFYINGEKISNDVLVPNFTDYGYRNNLDKREIPYTNIQRGYKIMYLGYNIKPFLLKGENVVGGIVGNGFYNAVRHWVAGYGSPRLLIQIQIEYEDGTKDYIVTNESWKVSKSAIIYDMIYTGEHYDARKEQSGWNKPLFDDSNWDNAILRNNPGGKLIAQNGPSDKVMEKIEPKSIKLLDNGNYLVDFGEEISGWVKINSIKGEAGRRIDINYICESPVGNNSYTLKGKGNESYSARFTWFVFRMVEIKNWPGKLRKEQITAEAVYSDVKESSFFECSNSLFNKIHQIWKRSQKDNMHGSIPSDCPHRERSAYTGDGQAVCSMVMKTFDAASFYNKWIDDIYLSQDIHTGYVPNGAPWQPGCGGGPGWGAAMNIVPWEFYLNYNDIDILKKCYLPMKEQVKYMLSYLNQDSIMEVKDICTWKTLGDWNPVKSFPNKSLVHTYFLYQCLDITAKTAKIIGKLDDNQYYSRLANKIRKKFHSKFWNKTLKTYGSAGANLFALKIGVPKEVIKDVKNTIQKDIEKNNYHLDTGNYGTQILFEILSEHGMIDLAYRIMNQTTYPSFGYWIKKGATTTWEQWDGNNSRNHPVFGSGLTWFYKYLAGIKLDSNNPGYRHFIINPCIVDSLSYVNYSYTTIYGIISSYWRYENNKFIIDIDVPTSCTATVYLPFKKGNKISESDKSFILNKSKLNKRNSTIKRHNKNIEINLNSGHYSFTILK